jgi:hypothetical protein
MRHGDRSFQPFNASRVHAVVLSEWHTLHALGILSASVSAGVMNLKVWARTFTSAIVCSILIGVLSAVIALILSVPLTLFVVWRNRLARPRARHGLIGRGHAPVARDRRRGCGGGERLPGVASVQAHDSRSTRLSVRGLRPRRVSSQPPEARFGPYVTADLNPSRLAIALTLAYNYR